ncbi:Rne/Rng family ribonuclease [Saccharibacter sp. 17.LH.SD]|nr:Rne/Rng family ribonuclease [Saccharibacter sp. 17.LH.SD]
MLIDATHAEETRVVVMNEKRIEDYDVETSARRQLKGNIYLAKIIRVEPSLQAAFVDYGGNRHGFLAFSEIHPDYFQIPVADREKLLALQEEEYATEQQALGDDDVDDGDSADANVQEDQDEHAQHRPEIVSGEHDTGDEQTANRRMARFLRNYRIQEVIRRRQVILVQVVKEERGNKGAALTTYISLAGRYGVLMPNAMRGGGVSRKITSDTDRKRLRDIVSHLNLPRSMAMIIRTAGAGRPETEIVRDCDYLLQLWDDIRSHALTSIAPTLVYEEASLIKRAIRDLFTRDIESVYVDGESAWKNAREFTRLLMPHNANRIRLWQNRGQSLFSHYNVEHHLNAMFSPTVRLEAGGYIVINQTEALVSIDVNSGKATSQRNIEETALRTNLEAAEEVARQLRLRDLAGLIVIDFIDMESRRNNNQVEKRLKEALRLDRARIQVGRISHFGLLEMSRQRLRPSLAESMLSPCPHCQGTGLVRGIESTTLHVLRTIEEEASRQLASAINVYIAPSIILYLLNSKRDSLAAIEQRHQLKISFQTDDSLVGSDIRIDRIQSRQTQAAPLAAPAPEKAPDTVRTIDIVAGEAPVPSSKEQQSFPSDDTQENNSSRRRRRRGRRRGQDRDYETASHDSENEEFRVPATPEEPHSAEEGLMPGRRRTRVRRVLPQKNEDTIPEKPARSRKFEKKGNIPSSPPQQQRPTPADPFQGFDIFDLIEQNDATFIQSRDISDIPSEKSAAFTAKKTAIEPTDRHISGNEHPVDVEALDTPKAPRRRRRSRKSNEQGTSIETTVSSDNSEPQNTSEPSEEKEKPVRRRRTTRSKSTEQQPVEASETSVPRPPQPINVDEAKPAKRRVGWWKR